MMEQRSRDTNSEGARIRPLRRRARSGLSRAVLAAFVFPLLAVSLTAQAQAPKGLEAAPAGLDARTLAERAENTLRSDRTYMKAEMTVKSPRLSSDRVVAFESWEDRKDRKSLIRIIAPAKDRGTGFLKLHPNLWMYIPRVERTVRIPPSMMLQSWMGSDFTNDDLVRESSELDDYDHRLLGIDPAAGDGKDRRAHVIEYVPHEDAPVVWGRIIAWLDEETGTPLRQEFHDEDDVLVRTMSFEEIRKVGDRHVPHLWRLTPAEKEGHETMVRLETVEYDVDLPDSLFTTRNLKRTN